MKCPICGNEMEEGRVNALSKSMWGTELNWYTEEDCSRPFKKKPFLYAKHTHIFYNLETRNDLPTGYYCGHCHKIVAILDDDTSDNTESDEYTQVSCPKCGKLYESDYPDCPYCKHNNSL